MSFQEFIEEYKKRRHIKKMEKCLNKPGVFPLYDLYGIMPSDEKTVKKKPTQNTKKRLLQEGDIITLKEGMEVYANIPHKNVYFNRPFSTELTRDKITIGEPRYSGAENTGAFDARPFAGDYTVVRAELNGGGTGHGPHDIYPDGHHVYCEKLAHPQIEVDFFQTGCFTAMIKDIEPRKRNFIGKQITKLKDKHQWNKIIKDPITEVENPKPVTQTNYMSSVQELIDSIEKQN